MSTQSRLFLPLPAARAFAFPLNDPARVLSAAALETAIELSLSRPEAKTHSSVTFKSALSPSSSQPTGQRGLAKQGHPDDPKLTRYKPKERERQRKESVREGGG